MKKRTLLLSILLLIVFAFTTSARGEVIVFEKYFDDLSGIAIGGGSAGYWGIAPLSGICNPYIPSFFIQGGSQDGNIFYGSYPKEYIGSPVYVFKWFWTEKV